MYTSILVPVDLEHRQGLEKAVSTAATLSKAYGIPMTLIGVTTNTPSAVAHTPQEFQQKMEAYAAEEGEKYGVEVKGLGVASHDPAVDLNETLIEQAEKRGDDLIVMASHIPGVAEHIFSSHAGYVAQHAPVSVMVVR
jgi:nucleotide-binding universal stress UspA family protein